MSERETHPVDAQARQKLLSLARARRRDPAPVRLGELDGADAHRGGPAVDEHVLALLKLRHGDQRLVRRVARETQARRLRWCVWKIVNPRGFRFTGLTRHGKQREPCR